MSNYQVSKANSTSLVGKFFHAPIKGTSSHWQGHVLSEQQGGHFMVQLYSWLDGGETDQKLVALGDMTVWTFYASEESWQEAGYRLLKEVGS